MYSRTRLYQLRVYRQFAYFGRFSSVPAETLYVSCVLNFVYISFTYIGNFPVSTPIFIPESILFVYNNTYVYKQRSLPECNIAGTWIFTVILQSRL